MFIDEQREPEQDADEEQAAVLVTAQQKIHPIRESRKRLLGELHARAASSASGSTLARSKTRITGLSRAALICILVGTLPTYGMHRGFSPVPLRLAVEVTEDNNGNLLSETTGSSVKGHGWDNDNRLRAVTMPDTSVHSYEYDANGLRTKQTTPSETKRYLLDGASVFAEYDAANSLTARYLLHPQVIDETLSFETGGATYYPLTDALGSVVAITDSAGALVRTNAYDVYGARSTSGTGPSPAWGFTGREHDATGLNYHRDRYVDPATGRWLQADRIGMADGPNRYQYVSVDPVRQKDATGFYASDSFTAAMLRSPIPMLYLLSQLEGSRVLEETAMQMQEAQRLECDPAARTSRRRPKVYYRGLSMTDLREMELEGVVKSKAFRRDGIFAALSVFGKSSIRDSALKNHVVDSDNPPSPFVGVTPRLQIAREYALGQNPFAGATERPSGVVAKLITFRDGMPGSIGDHEHAMPLSSVLRWTCSSRCMSAITCARSFGRVMASVPSRASSPHSSHECGLSQLQICPNHRAMTSGSG